MNNLWLLTESDGEDLIFEALVEKITGSRFQPISRRLTGSRGISGVQQNLKYFLKDIKRTGQMESSFFVVAVDNDRLARRPLIMARLTELIGPKEDWPIQGAVAVPIEMIESWALLATGKHGPDASLPRFSDAKSFIAKRELGSNAPPQLKELIAEERKAVGIGSSTDFILQALLNCEPEVLGERSASFREFYNEVNEWKESIGDPH